MEKGRIVAIKGPSGSGKTTLLNCISGLLVPQSGEIIINGQHILELEEKDRRSFIARTVGIVFQGFHVVPYFSVEENILFPLLVRGENITSDLLRRMEYLLKKVGMFEKRHVLVSQLSGGQQQRVAILRALLPMPAFILADEPTGNLDERVGLEVMQLLETIAKEEGIGVLLVSHEAAYVEKAEDVWELKGGSLEKVSLSA